MSATLVATAGAANANSYCTVAEADAYHEAHVTGATWAALTSDQKIRALIQATRQLDAHIRWHGVATHAETQALAWPRMGMYDPATDWEVDYETIPTALKHATAEQARLLSGRDRAVELSQQEQGIASLSVGSVSLVFSGSGGGAGASPTIAPSAWAFIADWGEQYGLGMVPLLRG